MCGGKIGRIAKLWESQTEHPAYLTHPMHRHPWRRSHGSWRWQKATNTFGLFELGALIGGPIVYFMYELYCVLDVSTDLSS